MKSVTFKSVLNVFVFVYVYNFDFTFWIKQIQNVVFIVIFILHFYCILSHKNSYTEYVKKQQDTYYP